MARKNQIYEKSKDSTNKNTSQSDDTTTDMSSLSNKVKTLENTRKLMHAITASGLTAKWINAHTVNNVGNAAATTTLRQNVKRKKKR